MSRVLSILIALFLAGGSAEAQIALPGGGLPALPDTGLPGSRVGFPGAAAPGGPVGLPNRLVPDIGRAASRLSRADVRRLESVRRNAVAALVRRFPRLIERDPQGAAILRGAVVAITPTDAALARARSAGFGVVRDEMLGALGVRIVVLRAPPGVSTERALAEMRSLDPGGSYDFDHLYSASGAGESAAAGMGAHGGRDAHAGRGVRSGGDGSAARGVTAGVRLGLIDGGVDLRHPAFRDVNVRLHGCGGVAVPSDHGTEVASLLVGRAGRFRGAAPGAALYAADVYCGKPTGGAVDAIADALDWLVRERVPVVNVSLVGPPDALLAAVVRSAIAHGCILVAAVGNDGPAAPPLYPAAYPGVVGVTGVDAHSRVLMEAERGAQVRFAAPGADMAAAAPPRAYAAVRGTSFAAPIVAGLLARELPAPDPARAAQAIAALETQAVDLGAPGPDPVYGYGLVGARLRPEPALADVR